MLKYSFRFEYQKNTVTLLAFLLEGDNFPGAFDAEELKAYVRLPWRKLFLIAY